MHILIISHGYPTSVDPQWGCFERDQAIALSRLGHKVTVASVDGRYRKYKRKFGIDHIIDGSINAYTIYYFPLAILLFRHFKRLFRNNLMLRVFNTICKEQGRPDVIYAHYMVCMAQLQKVKQKYNIPIIGIEHWSILNKNLLTKHETDLGHRAYGTVDGLLCVSVHLQNQIFKHFGKKAQVVPNMVNDVFLQHPIRINNEKSSFKFISVGSLNKGKGFDLLIQAFSMINDKRAELIIIGDGDERNNLLNLALNFHVNERVHFLGKLDRDVICMNLAQADAFVLASKAETFGVVYIEALAMGLPVVATQCGGTDDFMNEQCGLSIPIDDLDALVEAMNRMQSNIDIYDRYSLRNYINHRFSSEVIARQIESHLFQIMNK